MDKIDFEKLYQYLLTEDESFLNNLQKEKLPVFKLLRALFVLGCLLLPISVGLYLFFAVKDESFIVGLGILILLYKFLPSIYKKITKKINFEKYNKKDTD